MVLPVMADRPRPPVAGPRGLSDERGFLVLESLVAAALLVLILAGVVTALVVTSSASGENRNRTVATELASDFIERARALGYPDIRVKDDGTVPTTFTTRGPDGAPQSYQVVKSSSCTSCLTYQQSVTRQGVAYTVKQVVVQRHQYVDERNQTQNERQLIVIVGWTTPRSGSYELDTFVHGADPLAPTVTQGVRIEIDDAAGTQISDDSTFDVSIAGATTATGTTDEGAWENDTLPPGSYTCTVSTNATSPSYYPASGDPSGTQISRPCTVSAGGLTLVQTQWAQVTGCPTGNGNGTVTVTVTDPSSQPVAGATVTLTQSGGSGGVSQTTDANGKAAFTQPAGPYTFSGSKSGYVAGSANGTACIYANRPSLASGTLTPGSPGNSTVTLQVNVTNSSRATSARTYQVSANASGQGGQGNSQTITVNKGTTGTATLNTLPPGTYDVAVCVQGTPGPKGGTPPCNQIKSWTNQALTTAGQTYTLALTDTS